MLIALLILIRAKCQTTRQSLSQWRVVVIYAEGEDLHKQVSKVMYMWE